MGVLKLFVQIVVYCILLFDGAVAAPPPSSINDTKPLLLNQTRCTTVSCPALCSTPFYHRAKAFNNFSTLEATALHKSIRKPAVFNESILIHPLQKRSLRPISEMPRMYDRRDYVWRITRTIDRSVGWLYQHYRTRGGRLVRSRQWLFPTSGKMVVGLRGMIGYTAVIAVSQKGVSGSILAEEPIFERMDHTESSDSDFYQLGFEYLVRADRSYDGPGLYNLVEPGGLLAPETGPKVFILTPWPTPAERRRGIRTRFRWQRKIDQLRANLAGVFGREPAVVGYTRRSREDVEGHTPTGTRPWASIGGRAIVEVDMNDQQIELEPSIVASLGRWRLWVEERMVHSEAFCP